MNKLFRNTLLAVAMTAGFSMAAQAATADEVPPVSQDPVVQHLKLSNDQVTKIKGLHQEFETNVNNIKIEGFKDGALIDVIQSGKWDEAKVKQQLAAFGTVRSAGTLLPREILFWRQPGADAGTAYPG
ncbi:P pilus assembly/Cpx signaling pathway, periplasmic inhibitor/zinc-resistance associated protein [Raoultella ornithinolytica]|nr:P pilus assembly/Cpx signaling pathway, periplasmic inhibitor/zinc-resistance associated protein [Raoultella ornithinolytica]